MQTITSNISNEQKLTKRETTPEVPTESITPEKVYKGFEEWRRLGKQDPTEPSESSEQEESSEKDKGR